MIVIERKLVVFKDGRGRHPFQIWLTAIKDVEAIKIIETRLTRVRSGNFGDHKRIGEGVYEIRIDFGPGYRIYYAILDDILLIVYGGLKKTQYSDIKKAKSFWKTQKSRFN